MGRALAMLLAAHYMLAASISTDLIADGGSGWLSVLVLLSIGRRDEVRHLGPVSVSPLVVARVRKRRTVRYYEAPIVGAAR